MTSSRHAEASSTRAKPKSVHHRLNRPRPWRRSRRSIPAEVGVIDRRRACETFFWPPRRRPMPRLTRAWPPSTRSPKTCRTRPGTSRKEAWVTECFPPLTSSDSDHTTVTGSRSIAIRRELSRVRDWSAPTNQCAYRGQSEASHRCGQGLPRVDVTRDAVLEGLTSTDPAALSKDERERLVVNLREVLHRVNLYDNGNFKRYPGARAKALDRFNPTHVVERYEWLLGNAWPNLPEGEPKDYDDREQTVNEKREAAARLVLDEAKLDQILEAAAKVQYVGVFGHAFGKIVRDEPEDERVLDAALEQKPINEGFIVGYAMGRIEVIGRGWVGGQATRVQAKGPIPPEAIALLFLGLPEERSAWTEVAAQGPAVEAAYWKRARGHRSK